MDAPNSGKEAADGVTTMTGAGAMAAFAGFVIGITALTLFALNNLPR